MTYELHPACETCPYGVRRCRRIRPAASRSFSVCCGSECCHVRRRVLAATWAFWRLRCGRCACCDLLSGQQYTVTICMDGPYGCGAYGIARGFVLLHGAKGKHNLHVKIDGTAKSGVAVIHNQGGSLSTPQVMVLRCERLLFCTVRWSGRMQAGHQCCG